MTLADDDTNSILADNNHCEDVACGWAVLAGKGGGNVYILLKSRGTITFVKYISFYGQIVLLLLLVGYFHGVVCLQCSL